MKNKITKRNSKDIITDCTNQCKQMLIMSDIKRRTIAIVTKLPAKKENIYQRA
jgi:hypothetical protein